ncbi:MAG: AIM24 family protein, partial [Flavisolibacter sp.]|nr:AIM24 family protein [Flavisolibacter sp.]
RVTFASPYPGKIIAMDLMQLGGKMICQKDAFLCAAKGVSVGIEFQRKLGTGLFGGEGFIMQKLEGDGLAFVHAGGHILEKTLGPGELLKIDTGCIVAFTPTCDYDIQFVGGIRNTIFGGEGLFFATLRGPGKVWIQSLPISRLASRILQFATYKRKDEGSVLGGLGNVLDGDGW